MDMQGKDAEPLDADVWAERLRDLLHDCVGSMPAEEADRLREARALFLRNATSDMPDTSGFEGMLVAGAGESAALALLGPEQGFMLSRGGTGVCLATIALTGSAEDVTAEGATPALALLAAQTSALLADAEHARTQHRRDSAGAPMRLN